MYAAVTKCGSLVIEENPSSRRTVFIVRCRKKSSLRASVSFGPKEAHFGSRRAMYFVKIPLEYRVSRVRRKHQSCIAAIIMPITEFRKKKLLFVFNTFFDVNQSGGIDANDVDLAVEKICESRGWAPGHERYTRVKETLLKVWDGLKSGADENQDGQISREEWYSLWEDYAKNPAQPLEWQQTYMNFMFDLEDSSGDGSIDENEFSLVCSSHGVPEAESREAFKKLQVGDEVDRAKFIELWKVFFSSDEPSAPGNFIFGKTSF